MRDVEYLLTPKGYNFKALTERARECMGKDMGACWAMAADVFFMQVSVEKFDSIVAKLRQMGLQTEIDPTPDDVIRAMTEF